MCYSKAEGGLRCTNAILPRMERVSQEFQEAKAAYQAAKQAGSADAPALKTVAEDKVQEHNRLYAEYAATPSGRTALEQQLAAEPDPWSAKAARIRSHLTAGAALASKARDIRERTARARQRAQARRQALATNTPEAPRMGLGSTLPVQGFTASQLVKVNGLRDGDEVTVISGGQLRLITTGTFRGTRRGGDNNRGQVLIERSDGSLSTIPANAITNVHKAVSEPAETSAYVRGLEESGYTHFFIFDDEDPTPDRIIVARSDEEVASMLEMSSTKNAARLRRADGTWPSAVPPKPLSEPIGTPRLLR